MKGPWLTFVACSCAVMLLLAGCAVPRTLWPQKDLPRAELPGTLEGYVVLVASRSSDFKEALVAELGEALGSAGVTQVTVGVDDLKEIDAADYDAIVVISKCIASGLDPKVRSFLDRQNEQTNIIAVTTSGDGGWLPNMEDREFDALSSASRMTDVDALAEDVLAKVNACLQD